MDSQNKIHFKLDYFKNEVFHNSIKSHKSDFWLDFDRPKFYICLQTHFSVKKVAQNAISCFI